MELGSAAVGEEVATLREEVSTLRRQVSLLASVCKQFHTVMEAHAL